MFNKILIANRGEIALRIIWACKELGIKTVAVHSDVDIDSLHVRFADENICIGPAASPLSYLNVTNIIAAAEISNADAIHPGYGFLSENAEFAEVCAACNITFIGPTPETIRKLGNKAVAIETMKNAGVPVLPGSDGPITDVEAAKKQAEEIGLPIILKASSGGGGRGMRVVNDIEDFERSFEVCSSEAQNAFGDPDVYMEKFLTQPRHIEIQLLGDGKGKVLHLGERECSIQRRNQKLLEESPSPALSPEMREEICMAAVRGAEAVNYASAGTIEFLFDDASQSFSFMEMNTRIQVEHPVTENVTGIDLIKAQIAIAAGEGIPFEQEDISSTGHSIECRINAEDPDTFVPSPGKITTFKEPGGPGVRMDTAAYGGYFVSPHYDSMIAKLIVHGETRQEAIMRMERALESFVIEGIKTSIPLQLRILREQDFRDGNFSTRFMDRFMPAPKKRKKAAD